MRLPVTANPVGGLCQVYLEAYKDWLTEQSRSPNTLRSYFSRIKQFLFYLEYGKLEDALSNETSMIDSMQLYLLFLKESKTSPRSINAHIDALNNFSQFLGLKCPELIRQRCYDIPTRALTMDEQEKFLRSVDRQTSARDRAIALVIFGTGLRVAECARLDTSDIGADGTWICLSNDTRISLNARTTLALKQWLDERQRVAVAADSGLWLTKHGRRLSISGIAFLIKRIGWQARLFVSAETLRRTCLLDATNRFHRSDLVSTFGGYVSEATINRYGIALAIEPPISSD